LGTGPTELFHEPHVCSSKQQGLWNVPSCAIHFGLGGGGQCARRSLPRESSIALSQHIKQLCRKRICVLYLPPATELKVPKQAAHSWGTSLISLQERCEFEWPNSRGIKKNITLLTCRCSSSRSIYVEMNDPWNNAMAETAELRQPRITLQNKDIVSATWASKAMK
jgi:hypothetical protein